MVNELERARPAKFLFADSFGFVDTILDTDALVFWSCQDLRPDGLTMWSENADISELEC